MSITSVRKKKFSFWDKYCEAYAVLNMIQLKKAKNDKWRVLGPCVTNHNLETKGAEYRPNYVKYRLSAVGLQLCNQYKAPRIK